MRTLSEDQVRACAFHIVDIIETRALEILAQDPGLNDHQAFDQAIDQLAKGGAR